jgi:hypothetical protein
MNNNSHQLLFVHSCNSYAYFPLPIVFNNFSIGPIFFKNNTALPNIFLLPNVRVHYNNKLRQNSLGHKFKYITQKQISFFIPVINRLVFR